MKYGNRSPWKRYLASPLALILSFIVFILLARASFSISQKSTLSASRLAQARVEFEKLKSRQDDLSSKVGKLSSDGGLESEIRSKYRAVKDGESVAVIIDDSKSTSTATTSAPIKKGWWGRLMSKIGFK